MSGLIPGGEGGAEVDILLQQAFIRSPREGGGVKGGCATETRVDPLTPPLEVCK